MYVTRLIDKARCLNDFWFDTPEQAEAKMLELAKTHSYGYRIISVLDKATEKALACLHPDVLGRYFVYHLGCQVRIRPGFRTPGQPDCAYTVTDINPAAMCCRISRRSPGLPDDEESAELKTLFPL